MKYTSEQSLEFIQSRKSVYPQQFSNRPVSENEVYQLLEAARFAPTHKQTQPWNFHVFIGDGLGTFQSLQEGVLEDQSLSMDQFEKKREKMKAKIDKSAAVIGIIMKRDDQERVPEWEEMCAVACSVQNLLLHATSLQLGGYWSSGGGTNSEKVRSFLGLSKEDKHLGWIFLGSVEEAPTHVRKRFEVGQFLRVTNV